MNVAYPFHFDNRGRTAAVDDRTHIRDMIKQLLLTAPGERVNRPDFGAGLHGMVHAPNRFDVAAALQVSLHASLQRWMGDRIEVIDVDATAIEETLHVVIRFLHRATGDADEVKLDRGV